MLEISDWERAFLAHPAFARTAHHLGLLADGNGQSPGTGAGARISCGSAACTLIGPEHACELPGFVEAFDRFAAAAGPGRSVRVVASDRAEREKVSTGAALLANVLPILGPDTWRNVDAVMLIDSDGVYASATLTMSGPGIFVLDRHVLPNQTHTAELMLHEALHAKLRRLESHRSLVQRASALCRGEQVPIAWHRTQDGLQGWSIRRALAALHVYAHMTVFAIALQVKDADRQHGARLKSKAVFRANYLGRQLLNSRALTHEGVEFVGWLLSLLPLTQDIPTPARL